MRLVAVTVVEAWIGDVWDVAVEAEDGLSSDGCAARLAVYVGRSPASFPTDAITMKHTRARTATTIRIVRISARPGFMPFFINRPGSGRMQMVMTIATSNGVRIKASDRTPQKMIMTAATATSPPPRDKIYGRDPPPKSPVLVIRGEVFLVRNTRGTWATGYTPACQPAPAGPGQPRGATLF
jgi:hypothetical protein